MSCVQYDSGDPLANRCGILPISIYAYSNPGTAQYTSYIFTQPVDPGRNAETRLCTESLSFFHPSPNSTVRVDKIWNIIKFMKDLTACISKLLPRRRHDAVPCFQRPAYRIPIFSNRAVIQKRGVPSRSMAVNFTFIGSSARIFCYRAVVYHNFRGFAQKKMEFSRRDVRFYDTADRPGFMPLFFVFLYKCHSSGMSRDK